MTYWAPCEFDDLFTPTLPARQGGAGPENETNLPRNKTPRSSATRFGRELGEGGQRLERSDRGYPVCRGRVDPGAPCGSALNAQEDTCAESRGRSSSPPPWPVQHGRRSSRA